MGGRRKSVKIAKIAIGWLGIAAVVIWWFGFRLANPDMTETRLLLTFWWRYLVGLAILGVSGLLASEAI